MLSKTQSYPCNLTRHAQDRQRDRSIPTCLVRLALEKGAQLVRPDRVLFVLAVTQLDAAGFGPAAHALGVVVREQRIVTVMWLDGGAQ